MAKRYISQGAGNTNRNVYHTDPECPRLPETPREATERRTSHMTHCDWCDGVGGRDGGSKAIYHAARDAEVEDE